MKRKLTIFFSLVTLCAHAQLQTIDVDRLSTIISNKQQELKQRVLENLVVKNIRPDNYVTYNAIYNLVDIITSEKNKTVMTKKIVGHLTDYAIDISLAEYYVNTRIKFPMQAQASIDNIRSLMYRSMLTSNILKSDTAKSSKFFFYLGALDTTVKSGTQSVQRKNSTNRVPLYHGMNTTVLSNFIIDTLHQLLSNDSNLTKKGFFAADPERKVFTTGLSLHYDSIRHNQYFKDTIMVSLVKFVSDATNVPSPAGQIFTFIKNPDADLTKLNTANFAKNVIPLMLNLFDDVIANYRSKNGIAQNSFIATIGDIITKYFITNLSQQDTTQQPYKFKIDVDGIILSLEDKFANESLLSIQKHTVGFKPFFNIGLNYGHFINSDDAIGTTASPSTINQIELAGEKLGFKVIFADYEYTHSHSAGEWYKYRGYNVQWLTPPTKPLINNVYGFIYGSGLIYNIVNLKSNDNFKYVIMGAGGGIEFFNGLEINLSYVVPYIPQGSFKAMNTKAFINFGFDIPIVDYISEAVNKNK